MSRLVYQFGAQLIGAALAVTIAHMVAYIWKEVLKR